MGAELLHNVIKGFIYPVSQGAGMLLLQTSSKEQVLSNSLYT